MDLMLPPGVPPPDELCALTAAQQAAAVQAGEVRPRELAEAALRRIHAVDPALNCVRMARDEAALAEADAVEARVRAGEVLPLAGVTVGVKDNAEITGERISHGTGSLQAPATADAEVVRRLRAAGAVVVAITTMPELAQWASTETTSWGTTRNPWDRTRTPGGSSGGSAAAVAARLVALGQGDDGGASLRVPGACCGLVGLKPQCGRIPFSPNPETWHGLGHLGFVARDAADAGLALRTIGDGVPEAASARAASGDDGVPRRLRIAFTLKPPLPVPVSGEVRAATEAAAARLAALGHELVPCEPDWGVLAPAILPRYLAGVAESRAALDDPAAVDRRTRWLTGLGAVLPARAVRAARATEPRHRARLLGMFGGADVLLTPTTTRPAPAAGRSLDHGGLWTLLDLVAFIAFTAPWNLTGQPSISVPSGRDRRGVPLGAQLVARPGREDVLLSLAADLERSHPFAVPPATPTHA